MFDAYKLAVHVNFAKFITHLFTNGKGNFKIDCTTSMDFRGVSKQFFSSTHKVSKR